VELRDRELLLRLPTPTDVPAVADACQDSDLSRFIPGIPSPYTERDARAWIESRQRLDDTATFLIVDADSDELYGAVEVRLGETGSIGYWVAAAARGRGIATRATRLLATWAVQERGVERLELTTHPDNVASQRVAEKAGFTREGTLRSHTRFAEGRRDSVMFSLLPSDLESGGA
jgi:RimJ/RimL family protein N-acetyltransferase